MKTILIIILFIASSCIQLSTVDYSLHKKIDSLEYRVDALDQRINNNIWLYIDTSQRWNVHSDMIFKPDTAYLNNLKLW